MCLSDDDQLRADLIQQLMCQGEIPVGALERRYAIEFDQYFTDAIARLAPLMADGLLQRRPDRYVVTEQGRLLLRNIAMCFDAYLAPVADATSRFSRAI
jgi:oxygen-independent coproporphyrinogen-3 oxidase